jgi:hypothetical protein
VPKQRDEQACAGYMRYVAANYEPEQLVVVDEAAVNRKAVQRRRARAFMGSRARRRKFFTQGKRYDINLFSMLNVEHLKLFHSTSIVARRRASSAGS